MGSGTLNKVLRNRWTQWVPDPPQDVRRPAVFVLLFWTCWVATLLSHAFGLLDKDPAFGLVPVVLALVLLAALWAVLPWSPRTGPPRMLLAPAFLAGTFLVGHLTQLNISIVFYALVVANGVFLFGFRRGIAYTLAAVPVFFANVVIADGLGVASMATAIAVPFAVFMIGICAAVVEATGRREQAQVLLEDLESANAELRANVARVRELSVSEERARIAREIHDSVGHHLTMINLQLQNAQRFRERDPAGAWEEVGVARELALEALSEVRRAVRALKPLAVEETTGAGALAALARNLDGTGIGVSFEVGGEERELAEETELTLYRTMQEGLTNAARHAKARRVETTLTFSEFGVGLTVYDDGHGSEGGPFDGAQAGGAGFGLWSLKERVEGLGGTVEWGDRPEGGFALVVGLPDREPGRTSQ